MREDKIIGAKLGGTGDAQCDSRESIRANHSQLKPSFLARQADSPESLEFPIRANHATKGQKIEHAFFFFSTFRAPPGYPSKIPGCPAQKA